MPVADNKVKSFVFSEKKMTRLCEPFFLPIKSTYFTNNKTSYAA
jgi:hypothetical protein